MRNFLKITLLSLNPDFSLEQIDMLTDKLYDSKERNAAYDPSMFYNNVCYKIARDPDKELYAIVARPMTEEKYQRIISNNNE